MVNPTKKGILPAFYD